jgi:hypothetical protein
MSYARHALLAVAIPLTPAATLAQSGGGSGGGAAGSSSAGSAGAGGTATGGVMSGSGSAGAAPPGTISAGTANSCGRAGARMGTGAAFGDGAPATGNAVVDAQDRAVDRKVKCICEGC